MAGIDLEMFDRLPRLAQVPAGIDGPSGDDASMLRNDVLAEEVDDRAGMIRHDGQDLANVWTSSVLWYGQIAVLLV